MREKTHADLKKFHANNLKMAEEIWFFYNTEDF